MQSDRASFLAALNEGQARRVSKGRLRHIVIADSGRASSALSAATRMAMLTPAPPHTKAGCSGGAPGAGAGGAAAASAAGALSAPAAPSRPEARPRLRRLPRRAPPALLRRVARGALVAASSCAAAAAASVAATEVSFAASFSSCALYSCAARDVYCAHTADPSGAHPYCKDLHRVLHATEHGVDSEVVWHGSGRNPPRLRITGTVQCQWTQAPTFCSILSEPSSDQPCCLKNWRARPLPPTLMICTQCT